MAAICVFCASSRSLDRRWLALAGEVGREIAQRSHVLVSGGGCVGMMGAVADGTRAAGGHTLGIIPQSLVDLEVADTAADELLVTDTMAARKSLMMDKSDAFLTLPGGLGTLDELFEVWTTGTLRLHHKPVVLLDADGFYSGFVTWLRGLVGPGFVTTGGLEQLIVVDTVSDAFDVIEERLRMPVDHDPVQRPIPERVQRHVEDFNGAVRSGDWMTFTEGFDEKASMRFVGVPAGPFHGRQQIAAAYAAQPPTDTMTVTSVGTDGDTDEVRFAWDAGDTGTMTLRWHDQRVLDLTVSFD